MSDDRKKTEEINTDWITNNPVGYLDQCLDRPFDGEGIWFSWIEILAIHKGIKRKKNETLLTKTAFEVLRMCIERIGEDRPQYKTQAIELVNALEEESEKGS
jgi:hypothetical protein